MGIEYLNNAELEKAIERFRYARDFNSENRSEFEVSQAELAEAFYILASNIVKGFKFQLVDKDDALQEGVLICFEKLHYFDRSRGTAFNLYTTIIVNHFKQLYRSAKSYNELKIKYHDYICSKTGNVSIQTVNGKTKHLIKLRGDEE